MNSGDASITPNGSETLAAEVAEVPAEEAAEDGLDFASFHISGAVASD